MTVAPVKKASNLRVTTDFLGARAERLALMGYRKPRWVEFCEFTLRAGWTVSLYEARHTRSKYITVSDGRRSFKVRFSDHKPIKHREIGGDCDFFVGVTHLGVTTTGDAVRAVRAFFGASA